MLRHFIILIAISLNFSAHSDEASAPEETSLRSKPGVFWLGGSLGFTISPQWGVSTGWGLGGQVDAIARLQFGRWGILGTLRNEEMTYFDPANVHNTIVGLGPSFIVWEPGKSKRFWNGSQVLVHALWEYGESRYNVHSHEVEIGEGRSYGQGVEVGGDFFFPLWLKFWVYAGLDLEAIKFNYKVRPSQWAIHSTGQPNWGLQYHLGLSASF